MRYCYDGRRRKMVTAHEHDGLEQVMAFTVLRGTIVVIDVLADPARLRRLDLASLDD